MDPFTWAYAHPAEAAWLLFGALSVLVLAYKAQEAKIRAYVVSTPTDVDDRLVKVLDAVVAIFGVLRLIVPTLIGRDKPPATRKREEESAAWDVKP